MYQRTYSDLSKFFLKDDFVKVKQKGRCRIFGEQAKIDILSV